MDYPESVLTVNRKGQKEVRNLLSRGNFTEYNYTDPKTGKVLEQGKRSLILEGPSGKRHFFLIPLKDRKRSLGRQETGKGLKTDKFIKIPFFLLGMSNILPDYKKYIPEEYDEMTTLVEGSIEEQAELLSFRLEPGYYYEKNFFIGSQLSNISDTKAMKRYIERLKNAGLDVGKGDAEFGYRMPFPEKDQNKRKLIIFRKK